MSYLLKTESGVEFSFGDSGWQFYLKLAQHYGWQPEGTSKAKLFGLFSFWDATYDSAEGQAVSERDAANLAFALKMALGDDDLANTISAVSSEIERLFESLYGAIPDDLMESQEFQEIVELYEVKEFDRAFVQSFIRFCCMGGFTIHQALNTELA